MKIDSAIKVFSEKYDREAMQSIDIISQERGLILTEATIKAFNMSESFDNFSQYIQGYANYKADNKSNENASAQDVIQESVNSFISGELFKECNVKYADLPTFIMSYTKGIETLTEAVNISKQIMTDANVDHESIGDINEFTDRFMNTLHESFDPLMENILLASGYTGRKRRANKNIKKKAVFL